MLALNGARALNLSNASTTSLSCRKEAPYDGFTSQFRPDRNRPAFPWQIAVDRLLATAGFVPGNHVLLSVNYRSQQLTFSPDHNKRIGNREMTEQEIQDRIHHDE